MRYTIEEIRQMPEGQTFDCKSVHIELKALANTIVAMANADGGMIAVGISDKTRRIEGVDQDQGPLERNTAHSVRFLCTHHFGYDRVHALSRQRRQ